MAGQGQANMYGLQFMNQLEQKPQATAAVPVSAAPCPVSRKTDKPTNFKWMRAPSAQYDL